MQSAIQVNEVVVEYDGRKALAGVSLSVGRGETVGLFGPNGSGKSTLLRAIHGLVLPSYGSIEVLGEKLSPRTLRFIRKQMAYMPQFIQIDQRMPISALEVVLMGRYGHSGLFHRYSHSDKNAARAALEQVDALHLANRPFGQLSGGEQQRISLARALAGSPRLLLLDEPTASLDWRSQQRIEKLVQAACKLQGLTTLIVSHDAESLAAICDRIIIMDSGRIVKESIPSRLSEDYRNYFRGSEAVK